MKRFQAIAVVALGCGVVLSRVAWGADWLTDGKDQQRTNWQRDEKILTTANAKSMVCEAANQHAERSV